MREFSLFWCEGVAAQGAELRDILEVESSRIFAHDQNEDFSV